MYNNNQTQPQNFIPSKEELSEVATFLSTFFSPKYGLYNPDTGELLAHGKRHDDINPKKTDND